MTQATNESLQALAAPILAQFGSLHPSLKLVASDAEYLRFEFDGSTGDEVLSEVDTVEIAGYEFDGYDEDGNACWRVLA